MLRKKIVTMYGLEDLKDDHNPTLRSIRFHANSIGMEAFAGEAGLRSAVNRLPILFKRISTFLSVRFDNDRNPANFHKPESFNKSRYPDYMILRDMIAYKSPGQTVPTLELTEALLAAFKEVVHPLDKTILPELDRFIGRILSNPDELRSQRTFTFIQKEQAAVLENIIKKLGKCFDPKDTKTEAKFGELYARNSDLDSVVAMLEELNKQTYEISGKDILKRVESISTSMDILTDKITHKAPGYDFTPSVVKGLADACHDTAMFVEFYSVYMYKLREATIAVRDTLEKISKL